MGVLLSVLALACAAVACAAAMRTQRSVHRLAKALAREWGLRTGPGSALALRADPPGEPAAGLTEREEWLKRSVEALEQRLREVLSRAAGLESAVPTQAQRASSGRAAPGSDPRERVRQHLEALGYEEVAVLPGRGGAAGFTFEARREGMPAKGSARLGADGGVELRWAAAQRAFP